MISRADFSLQFFMVSISTN